MSEKQRTILLILIVILSATNLILDIIKG